MRKFCFNAFGQGMMMGVLSLGFMGFLGASVNITTYKEDNAHTGQNLSETILTPANVGAAGSFGQLFTQNLDGQCYTQPLYLSGIHFPNGTIHNVVFVATQHDSVYAFDADNNTGANSQPLWHRSFIPADGATTIPPGDASTSDITFEIGITSTPVIDPASGTLYVVSKTRTVSGSTKTYAQYLHALDITTGADKVAKQQINPPPIVGTGNGQVGGKIPFDSLRQHLRCSMTLYNGVLYLAYASHSDQGNYHGLILAYSAANLQYMKSFAVTPNGSEGGIWAAGCGPAIDGSGNMFVTTGNGAFDQNVSNAYDWSECFLKLPTSGTFYVNNLNTDYFCPNDQANLTRTDADLGSSGVLLLPDQAGPHQHVMLSGGKGDVVYLVDRDVLGGNVPSGQTDKVVQEIKEPRRLFCSPSYFNGYVYYAPEGGNLVSRQIGYNSATNTYLSTSAVTSRETFSAHGASAIISSNGVNNGILWIINQATPSVLYAYDATKFSTSSTTPVQSIYSFTTLFGSGSSVLNDTANKFTFPTVANGKVYLTAYDPSGSVGHLFVLGLLTASSSAPAAPSNLVATASSSSQVVLQWTDNSNNESGFAISRATSPNGPFTQAGLVGANISTFSDSGLSPLSTYYYQVSATNNVGSSSPTNIASAATFAPYTPAGLLAYWNFDEGTGTKANDVTEHGYAGVLNGEVGWIPGFCGLSALNFHGTGNAVANVTVPNSAALQFSATQSFTLSAWVQPSGPRSADQGVICKSRDQGNYYGIWINSSNQWVFRGPTADVVGSAATTNWTHVAAVQDGVAKKRYLYINGVLAASGPSQAADGAGALWFGQANSVTQPFPGNIDEVRLYNRALAANEVTTLLGPPVLQALSVQNQGSSGSLGMIIPVDQTVYVESRQGTTSGAYSLVLSFSSPVSGISASLGLQAGEPGSAVGTVGAVSYDSTKMMVTIPLTGVGNGQRLNLHLTGITPGAGTADVPFNVLWGDANGDGIVNQEDLTLVQANFTTSLSDATAGYDFNCDGVVNAADANVVTANLGKHLGGLPFAASDRDIGEVNFKGSLSYQNGAYTLNSSGLVIYQQADSFHYVYQSLTGDGAIIARVTSQTNSSTDKTGVMIRQDLTPSSPNYCIEMMNGVGVKTGARSTVGGGTALTQVSGATPIWLKVARAGNVFSAYQSTDGNTWVQAGNPVTIVMPSSVYIGVDQCAYDNDLISTGTLDSVGVVPSNLWSTRDVGSVSSAGTSGYDNGVLSLSNSGVDIWGTADQFRYTYRSLTGDGTITARVATLGGVNSWTKAGVMIRATLDPASVHAMTVLTPGNGVAFQWRPTAGGVTDWGSSRTGSVPAPYWVRLVRSGNTFTSYCSADGVTWTSYGTTTISMPSTVYVGLVLSSHTSTATAQASFDHITIP